MNVTPMQMYWITRLDSIDGFIVFIGCVLFLIGVVSGIIGVIKASAVQKYSWESREDIERENRIGKNLLKVILPVCLTVTMISFLISVLTPTTKQMAAIIIVPKIANSEKVQTIGNNVYDLAVEWMNELKPTKKEGAK